ncbi:MAG: hypothetical protein WD690_06825 [Vicinamibacterales bacterium]
MFIAAAIAAVVATPAFAQPRPPASIDASVALGLVWHGAIVGDDDPKEAGAVRPIVSFIARGQLHRLAGFTFESTLEPMGLDNPHFDERLHSLHLLAGIEIGRAIP